VGTSAASRSTNSSGSKSSAVEPSRHERGERRPDGLTHWPWARLLRRVFALEVPICDRGGPRRILGAVTEPHAVRRLLAALGLAAEPPPGRPVSAA
jgi:hypothetical protein